MTAVDFDLWTPETPSAELPDSGHKPAVIHWAHEALEPQPPIEWVVDQLCSTGSVGVVAGEGGTKKTYCMADLAVCVALGRTWLNMETTQMTALIVDEESGPRRLARRLGEIMRAQGADAETPLAYTSLAGFNLRDPLCVADLDAVMGETGARFVVIDALADVMVGGDENTVKDVQPVFMALRRLADKYSAAIVIIHHTGKNGDYRGSSALKGAVDLLLKVTSQPKSKVVSFEVEKQRDVEPFKFSACIEFEPGRTIVSSTTATATSRLAAGARYALRYLSEHGTSLLVDLMAKADSCSPSAARQGVYALASEGLAARTDDGGPGAKAQYGLTPAGRERLEREPV